ncbi:hypothetical protein M409DRAFT_71691 [Zasmidium cellare ATCC 36951]|uniref:ABC transporter domain-containing protein n=1 Tax=Zasmidium cellare ATCC 36951 TaxID=1080233 RepID=A0A6A6BU65_ZASCE|nr:uncharacterized protein M409DRAFT_71691 [Zasmidium cellare ATCC 36951]KAF2158337.1 hypothetical protein M409DRAFT_71691 [Zasmidium cellare ATCC 36951]
MAMNSTPRIGYNTNDSVRSLSWNDVSVTVKPRRAHSQDILRNVSGIVQAGEMMAIMGPSGSGKSTLLNALMNRHSNRSTKISGGPRINGLEVEASYMHQLSTYVEQDDALCGSLTVQETLQFAARLSLKLSPADEQARVNFLLDAFGLSHHAGTIVGTAVRKGISGGQKRRVSIAAQLITGPKIILLDEPTSGLDSQAAFEIVKLVKRITMEYKPSTAIYEMFDKILLLTHGVTAFNGSIAEVQPYFRAVQSPVPPFTNPAEHILAYANTGFGQTLPVVRNAWLRSSQIQTTNTEMEYANVKASIEPQVPDQQSYVRPGFVVITKTLIHRAFIKSYRDVVAYGIRMAMYLGLAIMMGTIWIRLRPVQENIQALTNAIFFSGAFMSFMAVAYIPAFLEDRALFTRERGNGLYGPTPFVIANFLTGVPYLLAIALVFSLVVYWLCNFNPTGHSFIIWTLWLFLDLLAAESLVILISSSVPVFIVALAGTAFANGLWMCTGGFLVRPQTLNPFWRYLFHYIDYQSYVFQGMMVNEFGDRNYSCAAQEVGRCSCIYRTELEEECLIAGRGVLEQYGYDDRQTGTWAAILITIIVVYRVLAWVVLWVRRR